MATILHLADQGRITKFDPELSWREQEERILFLSPTATTWLENALPNAESQWNLDTSPLEQVADLLSQFCSGKELTVDWQFKCLTHIDAGVWELKTADVRLFGWFHAKDCFVCTAGDLKWKILEGRLYPFYRDQAVRFREQLDLDEPKFVIGDDPNDVISPFSYP